MQKVRGRQSGSTQQSGKGGKRHIGALQGMEGGDSCRRAHGYIRLRYPGQRQGVEQEHNVA